MGKTLELALPKGGHLIGQKAKVLNIIGCLVNDINQNHKTIIHTNRKTCNEKDCQWQLLVKIAATGNHMLHVGESVG